ncbi:hypothetical protein BDN70DRAFT_881105 [Pholiota conissans]|uniref:Uncharacterized protein n=1 Tax=Pholiota conissans TaxID=109636 RepID=A0A9P6CYI9_9AGAR|nr:hypothetical protein BDN70DRAFT_881105 [Pholiota conissans]
MIRKGCSGRRKLRRKVPIEYRLEKGVAGKALCVILRALGPCEDVQGLLGFYRRRYKRYRKVILASMAVKFSARLREELECKHRGSDMKAMEVHTTKWFNSKLKLRRFNIIECCVASLGRSLIEDNKDRSGKISAMIAGRARREQGVSRAVSSDVTHS